MGLWIITLVAIRFDSRIKPNNSEIEPQFLLFNILVQLHCVCLFTGCMKMNIYVKCWLCVFQLFIVRKKLETAAWNEYWCSISIAFVGKYWKSVIDVAWRNPGLYSVQKRTHLWFIQIVPKNLKLFSEFLKTVCKVSNSLNTDQNPNFGCQGLMEPVNAKMACGKWCI